MHDAPPPEAIEAAEEMGEGKPLGTSEVRTDDAPVEPNP